MRCIHCHSPLFSLHSQLKNTKSLNRNELFGVSRGVTRGVLPQRQSDPSAVRLRCNAGGISSFLVLDISSPAKGDIKDFLLTSAGLFFMYWVANFLVPDLISKYFQFDKISEDQKPGDKDP